MVALLLAAGSLAEILTTNFGGYLVDRFDRRWTCLVCDLVRITIMAASVFGLLNAEPLPVLVVSWLTYAVVDRTYLTSLQAIIPSIVSPGKLLAVNSMSYIAMQVGNFVAALGAGFLLLGVPTQYCLLAPLTCFVLSVATLAGGQWKGPGSGGPKGSVSSGAMFYQRHCPVEDCVSVR
ncbi:hypothetical protein AJ87_13090 [Rhizobium yanglingense]|nr:hypothetical protein AJ87_13090 [Rhizobium yanglingense]